MSRAAITPPESDLTDLNVARDVLATEAAGLRSLAGGEIVEYTQMLEEARRETSRPMP